MVKAKSIIARVATANQIPPIFAQRKVSTDRKNS